MRSVCDAVHGGGAAGCCLPACLAVLGRGRRRPVATGRGLSSRVLPCRERSHNFVFSCKTEQEHAEFLPRGLAASGKVLASFMKRKLDYFPEAIN